MQYTIHATLLRNKLLNKSRPDGSIPGPTDNVVAPVLQTRDQTPMTMYSVDQLTSRGLPDLQRGMGNERESTMG